MDSHLLSLCLSLSLSSPENLSRMSSHQVARKNYTSPDIFSVATVFSLSLLLPKVDPWEEKSSLCPTKRAHCLRRGLSPNPAYPLQTGKVCFACVVRRRCERTWVNNQELATLILGGALNSGVSLIYYEKLN